MNSLHYRSLLVLSALVFSTIPARAEFVRGELTTWNPSAGMTQDAGFGNVWKETLTSPGNDNPSEYKFDRFGDWAENWGAGTSASKNSTVGSLSVSGGNLGFDQVSGKRYSFQMTADHTSHVVMETDGQPVDILTVSDNHDAAGTGPVSVSISLSAARSPQETVYVRYATNIAFPSSWLAAASGSGSNVAASIPGFTVGTRVYYYILSSTMPTGQILSQADLCTLRGKNAGSSNFYYEVTSSSFTGIVPTVEFTETNAAEWGSFSTVDFAATSVSNDATKVKLGNASIRFDTLSGFPTGVRYPGASTSHWNVTSFTHLQFWAFAINTNQFGFQDAQPIVRLKSPAGTFTYTPSGTLMYNSTWHLYRIPLSGDGTCARTMSGSPSLLDVTEIEIQMDTWSAGFTVYFDGMKFVSLTPGLPPAGPPPPPGVNPDAIEPRVLLYIYDPIVESMASQRMHAAYGWTDPAWLANQMASDLRSNSHDLVRYKIVATNIVDDYPYFLDGYKFDDASFHTTWTSRVEHPSMFDYARFVNSNGITPRIVSGEFDEVWLYTMPFVGTWESTMAGDGGYWCNSPPVSGVPSERLFVIMGLNYERGVAEAIHSYGHRAESIMVHSYGTWLANTNNNWNKFTLRESQIPGQGHVGNIHFPVNATADYEYASTTLVPSYHQRWYSYPDLGGTSSPQMVNVFTWSPTLADPQRDYLNWWYNHLPHFSGRGPDFFLNNWWRYIADPNQFKSSDGNLLYTEGIPTARVITLTNGAEVCGYVPVTVDASVDGALGRVDLYVDGAYHSSDTLSPYTFKWDVTGLAGTHALVAKAVELQNGTESTSSVVSVEVQPMTVSSLAPATGGVAVTWHSCANWTSMIQRAAEVAGPWLSDTGTLSVATTSSVHSKLLIPAPGQTGAFFRVQWLEP